MTRNAFLLLLALFPHSSFATVDSPVVQGLGGASRAGVSREAVFSNPAAVAQIANTFAFVNYEIPKIPDFNAGGRSYSAGMYDGGDKDWKGGFSYSRISKARIFQGRQGFIDRKEIRFSTAHVAYQDVVVGLAARMIKNYNDSTDPSNFYEGDLGVMMPIYGDLKGGMTFENILNREDELPQTVGIGASYGFGMGFQLVADGYRLMSGTKNGERGWALGGEAGLTGSFLFRGGLFEEAYRGLKGWAVGGSWIGPRLSLDYALKVTGKGPKERSHIMGLTMAL